MCSFSKPSGEGSASDVESHHYPKENTLSPPGSTPQSRVSVKHLHAVCSKAEQLETSFKANLAFKFLPLASSACTGVPAGLGGVGPQNRLFWAQQFRNRFIRPNFLLETQGLMCSFSKPSGEGSASDVESHHYPKENTLSPPGSTPQSRVSVKHLHAVCSKAEQLETSFKANLAFKFLPLASSTPPTLEPDQRFEQRKREVTGEGIFAT